MICGSMLQPISPLQLNFIDVVQRSCKFKNLDVSCEFLTSAVQTHKIIQIKYIHSLSCSEVTVKLVVMMSQSYTNKICICLTLQMNIGHVNIFFTSHLYLLDTGSPLHHSNVSVCAHTTSNYVNTLDQD